MGQGLSERVLVVAAHPDDELLGCGGTIACHADMGDEVHVLILAEGGTARDVVRNPDVRANEISALRMAASQAATILGAQMPKFGDLPDNRMDTIPLLDVVKIVERALVETVPSVVYTHHGGDLNVDHRLTNAAVLTACRPLPDLSVKAIYAFETVSSTEWAASGGSAAFTPRRFVDISSQMERKRRALECYRKEMRAFPHARSMENVDALARTRGATVGLWAAEAFDIIRELVR